jgi:Tfp pilus assembly protein PilZ
MENSQFVNRRREHRLPYFEKVIFSDGTNHLTAHAINLSRGGLFVTTLDSPPIETHGHLVFMLSSSPKTLCVKVRVAHVVFDLQRCEVECGMGLQFQETTQNQLNLLNIHLSNDQNRYLELRELLKGQKPDMHEVKRLIYQLPGLAHYDLLGLRYRVNRICTLFDNALVGSLT